MLCGFITGWTGPLIPCIARERSLDLSEAGLIVSVSAAGSMLTLLLGKTVTDKYGSSGCLAFAAALLGLGMSGIVVAPNLLLIALSAFVLGMGSGFNSIGSATTAFDTGGGASAMNKLNFFFGVGALIGPMIAWAGTSSPWSYHGVYGFGAMFALAAFIGLIKLSSRAVVVGKARMGSSIMGSLTLWAYALVIFLYVGIETGTATWLYTYLQKYCGLSVAMASLCMTTLWGGLTTSRMMGIFLTKRIKARKVNIVAISCAVGALVLLCSGVHPLFFTVALVAALGLGYGPVFPNTVASANERFAGNASTASAVVITSGAVGAITVPLLIGFCFKTVGLRPGMEVIAGLAFLMFLVFLSLGLDRANISSSGSKAGSEAGSAAA